MRRPASPASPPHLLLSPSSSPPPDLRVLSRLQLSPPKTILASRIARFLRGPAFRFSLPSLLARLARSSLIAEWPAEARFPDMTARSQKKWVIRDFKRLVTSIIFLIQRAVVRRGLPLDKDETVEQFNVRVLMAAFLVVNRPGSCFESIGHLEQQVQHAAADLVTTLRHICSSIESSRAQPLTQHDWSSWRPFLKQLNVYLARFKDWKVPDEHKLTERIKHALLALYRAESHLSPDVQEYMPMKEEFRAQKAKLRAKMLQIAGAQGLESFDEALRQQGFTAVDAEPSEETASSSSQGAGSSSRPAELPSSTNASGLSSLPGRMTNEQLAHELLLDPAFKLDEQGAGYLDNPVLSKVRESFKVAFWDSLVDDLRLTPPCYVRVLKVVGEVRDGMIDLSPSRSKELKEKIDTAYWQEQIESGALDWSSCVSLIEGMLGIAMEMQEPSRKQETQAGWKALEEELRAGTPEDQPTLFCKALEYVLGRVNVMRVDAANARLRNIAHVIQNHGIEYERAHMDKKIKANPAYLQRTPEWIRAVVEKEVGRGRADLSKLVQGEGAAYEQIHTAAVLSLIMGSEPVKTDACPETLQLDISRLRKYHADFHFDVLAACMLAVASQRLMATKKDPKVTELLEHLKTSLNSFEASLVDKEERVKAATSSFEAELSAAEKEVIASCLSPSQPSAYSREMLERLLEVPAMVLEKSYGPMEEQWLRLVSADGSKVESDVPQSPFVRNVYERVVRNARRVRKVISLNRKVHYDRYNQIITFSTGALSIRVGA
ncbi:hypothetical protein GUITHDRAFT_102857 [Guillardia theta CCMP2712]|uniref:Uncharacterized protein n=1 Tax=Guillardia theta (strain CCMP2712) TaxID=905079 RepID=L1JSQ1_GUITC|nr:hypothetical protein GUITHDRAFT_102857 [Guillardia theta CCMP2712]EKX51596.1 hypothetical protein GUITHDRAFT_102857 [Guillardia theta CCMP2712]|eukprot:XP_005838576.1 hypothetical protein GUITHDRAFT_102857 [Guillardia theta CCMP2712]